MSYQLGRQFESCEQPQVRITTSANTVGLNGPFCGSAALCAPTVTMLPPVDDQERDAPLIRRRGTYLATYLAHRNPAEAQATPVCASDRFAALARNISRLIAAS